MDFFIVIKVGCCGFQRNRKEYYKIFKVVEIQETFYNIPATERMKELRKEAPADFEFTVKCFQGVTHPPSSPTWKRSKIKVDESSKYGNLQPSKEVFDSWEKTLEICKILDSKICLIQLPASFRDSHENINNAEQFFSSINKNEINIAIELRGWSEENIKTLCEKFDLIHCVDLFAGKPLYLSTKEILYTRLHGSPPGKKMYSYKFTLNDLNILKENVDKIYAKQKYILFNNIYMFEDAKEFQKIIMK